MLFREQLSESVSGLVKLVEGRLDTASVAEAQVLLRSTECAVHLSLMLIFADGKDFNGYGLAAEDLRRIVQTLDALHEELRQEETDYERIRTLAEPLKEFAFRVESVSSRLGG